MHTQWMVALTLRGPSLLWTEWRARSGYTYTQTHWMFALTSRGPSLLWTEWRARCGYTHWMFALTSKGQWLLSTEWRAKLSLPGGERIGSSWWPWRDADVLVVSWLACWLRVVLQIAVGSHLFTVWVVLLDHWLGAPECLGLRWPRGWK
jgi:hypothetical protein